MARERVVGSIREGTTVTNRVDCLVAWSFFYNADGVRTGAFLVHRVPDVDPSTDARGCYAVSHVPTHLHVPYLFKTEDDASSFAEDLSSVLGDKVYTVSPTEFQSNLYAIPDLLGIASRHNLHLFVSFPIEYFINETIRGVCNGEN